MNTGEEVAGGLFVARGDGPERLERIGESFDKVAFGVERESQARFVLRLAFGGMTGNATHREAVDEAVRVVVFVADERLWRDVRSQRRGLGDVVNLATGQADRQRVAKSVDFRRQAAARAADGWVFAPFFRAPALC